MSTERKFFETMESDIMNADIPETERNKLMRNLINLKDQKINLLITEQQAAVRVRRSMRCSTRRLQRLALVWIRRLWISPDMILTIWFSGTAQVWETARKRITATRRTSFSKLNERDENGNLLIDLVLVILDGSTRDLGTSYELINQVIVPNLGEDKSGRILVAINQADVAMKGRYWNSEENRPEPQLVEFLEKKAESVRKRIKEGTGLDVTPIYYSAGFKEEGRNSADHTLSKLLCYIVKYSNLRKNVWHW